MWPSNSSSFRWRNLFDGSAAMNCEESNIKAASEESLLLQGPGGVGSSEEDVEQTEKSDADYRGRNAAPAPSDSTSEESSSCRAGSRTSCFSLQTTNKPSQQLSLSPPGHGESLLGCQNANTTRREDPDNSLSSDDSQRPLPSLKIPSESSTKSIRCPSELSANDASPPCNASAHVSPSLPVVASAVHPGGTGTTPVGSSGGRSWIPTQQRLQTVSIGGDVRSSSSGTPGCLHPAVFLGPNSQAPALSANNTVGSSALSGSAGHRLSTCSFGTNQCLPSALTAGGSFAALGSYTQQQKQNQQQALYLKQQPSFSSTARPKGDVAVIISALRRHLRSLIRIMYNWQPTTGGTQTSSAAEETADQKKTETLLYSHAEPRECVDSVPQNEMQNPSDCCLGGLIHTAQGDHKEGSSSVSIQEDELSFKSTCQAAPGITAHKDVAGLNKSTASDVTFSTTPHDEGTHCHDDSSEAASCPTASTRCRIVAGISAMATEVPPLPPLGSVDGASESWEGQRFFHEEHLDACSLSELREYLLIFSSFLCLPLPEVSKQEPSALQHVRLQLLLLRNSQQQRIQQIRQARPILQRWLPLLHSTTSGGSADDDEACLSSAVGTAMPAVESRFHSTASGSTLPSMPFSSTSLSFLYSFASPSIPHLDADLSSLSTLAMHGDQTASLGASTTGEDSHFLSLLCCLMFLSLDVPVFAFSFTTGECAEATAPIEARSSEFPSSSVDAFSVDGPPSSGSNISNTEAPPIITDCSIPPPSAMAFVTAVANEEPACEPLHPSSKEKTSLSWNSECGCAPRGLVAPATGLRWSSGTTVGIRLQGLIGGSSLGLGSSISLPEGAAGVIQRATEITASGGLSSNSRGGIGALSGGGTTSTVASPPHLEWICDATTNAVSNSPPGTSLPSYILFNNGQSPSSVNSVPFARPCNNSRRAANGCSTASPAELGLVISAEGFGQGRTQRGNVQVTFSPQMGAWVVCCARGLLQQSRAFSVATLGFEGAKKTAQQYATHCRSMYLCALQRIATKPALWLGCLYYTTQKLVAPVGKQSCSIRNTLHVSSSIGSFASSGRRQCSSKRASDRTSKSKGGDSREEAARGAARGAKEACRRSGNAVTPIPQVTLGLAGPPGGAFNLARTSSQEFILPKSVSKTTVKVRKDTTVSSTKSQYLTSLFAQ